MLTGGARQHESADQPEAGEYRARTDQRHAAGGERDGATGKPLMETPRQGSENDGGHDEKPTKGEAPSAEVHQGRAHDERSPDAEAKR